VWVEGVMGVGVLSDLVNEQGAKASGRAGAVLVGLTTAIDMLVPWYSPYFTSLLGLRPADTYLDVACGAGVFLRRRAKHVHRVAGIDHSDVSIRMARRVLRDRLADGSAQVVEGDAVVLPWPDETFSAVSCNCIDCFAPGKPAQTVQEMHRVLKPGGRVVIGLEAQMADPDQAVAAMRPWLRPVGRVLARVFGPSRYTDPGRARAYERRTGMSMILDSELRGMLEDAGFVDVTLPLGTWNVFATGRKA
jgi:ubiquinone/menaquinone biosynthesis C-methylase UbiE